MAHLKACRAILLGNRIYKPGEALPANNATMVKAWVSSGSAEWSDGPIAEQREEIPVYTADMDIGILREAGKKYSLKFKVGMKKSEMAKALNDAAQKAASAAVEDDEAAAKAKAEEEEALKADLLVRIEALQLELPDDLTLEQVKEAVEKAEAEAAKNGGGQV